MNHWHMKYIGMPWIAYTNGPDSYDCWGLVQHCLYKYYGVEVPRYAEVVTDDFTSNPINKKFSLNKHGQLERNDGGNLTLSTIFDSVVDKEIASCAWSIIKDPVDGAVVIMARDTMFYHVGIYVAGGVLHSRDGCGVSLESTTKLGHMGFKRIRFYIHNNLVQD